MKLKNFILFFVIFFICSCTSTNVVYKTNPTVVVTVEDIQNNVTNNKSKYIIKAWSKYPKMKQYKIYSDFIYNIGDTIIVNK